MAVCLALGALLLSAQGPWPRPAADIGPALSTVGTICVAVYIALVGAVIGSVGTRLPWHRAGSVAVAFCGAMLALGAVLAAATHDGALYPPGLPLAAAIAVTGAALSVNGLPVVARLLSDGGRLATPLGALALSSGALITAFTFAALRVGAVIDGRPLGPRVLLSLTVLAAFAIGFASSGRNGPVGAGAQRWTVWAGRVLLPVYFLSAGRSLGGLELPSGTALAVGSFAVFVAVVAWPVAICAGRLAGLPRADLRPLADLSLCRGVVMIIVALQAHNEGLLSGAATLALTIAAVVGTGLAGLLVTLPIRRSAAL